MKTIKKNTRIYSHEGIKMINECTSAIKGGLLLSRAFRRKPDLLRKQKKSLKYCYCTSTCVLATSRGFFLTEAFFKTGTDYLLVILINNNFDEKGLWEMSSGDLKEKGDDVGEDEGTVRGQEAAGPIPRKS